MTADPTLLLASLAMAVCVFLVRARWRESRRLIRAADALCRHEVKA